jgi:hypothetical protein
MKDCELQGPLKDSRKAESKTAVAYKDFAHLLSKVAATNGKRAVS